MPITILSPSAPPPRAPPAVSSPGSDVDMDSDSDSDEGGAGVDLGTWKRDDGLRDEILTPGAVITSNPQWMR